MIADEIDLVQILLVHSSKHKGDVRLIRKSAFRMELPLLTMHKKREDERLECSTYESLGPRHHGIRQFARRPQVSKRCAFFYNLDTQDHHQPERIEGQ